MIIAYYICVTKKTNKMKIIIKENEQVAEITIDLSGCVHAYAYREAFIGALKAERWSDDFIHKVMNEQKEE